MSLRHYRDASRVESVGFTNDETLVKTRRIDDESLERFAGELDVYVDISIAHPFGQVEYCVISMMKGRIFANSIGCKDDAVDVVSEGLRHGLVGLG